MTKTTTSVEKAYWRPADIAERLSLGLRTVYELIKAGEFGETVRFGVGRNGLRVTAEGLAAFEERRRTR